MAEKIRPRFPISLLWMLDNKFRESFGTHKEYFLKSGITQGMRILEPGCGSGLIAKSLSDVIGKTGWVLSFDVNPRMVELARNRLSKIKSVSLMVCNANDLPIAMLAEAFDAIVFYYVLHEIPNRPLLLEKCFHLLRKDGLLIIAEPRIEVNNKFLSSEVNQVEAVGFKLLSQSVTLPFRAELVFRKGERHNGTRTTYSRCS